MIAEGRKSVVIENVRPQTDDGRYPIKRVISEKAMVQTDIFTDGHAAISERLLYKSRGNTNREETPMQSMEIINSFINCREVL